MADFNPPYAYRPWDLDDWGTIRDADGNPMIKINCYFSGDLAEHRRNKTDPCETLGKQVVAALNASSEGKPGSDPMVVRREDFAEFNEAALAYFNKLNKWLLSSDANLRAFPAWDEGEAMMLAAKRLGDNSPCVFPAPPVERAASERCQFSECKSGEPATIHVNENIDDGSWRIGICSRCASITGLADGDDITDGHKVNTDLRAAYTPVSVQEKNSE